METSRALKIGNFEKNTHLLTDALPRDL